LLRSHKEVEHLYQQIYTHAYETLAMSYRVLNHNETWKERRGLSAPSFDIDL